MKRILASFLAGLLFIAQAAQADLTINELNGFDVASAPAGGGGPPTLTFLQCSTEQASSSSVATFTSQNTGTADANRQTIIGIGIEDAANTFTVNGVTVGGDSATEAVDEGGTLASSAAIYILNNPSGTSETIAVTFSEDISGAVVCLWEATNLTSLTPVSFNSDAAASGGILTLNLSATISGGVAVGVCPTNLNSGGFIAWTGLTERSEADVGAMHMSSADAFPTSGSALNITCDWNSTGTGSGAAAAFQ